MILDARRPLNGLLWSILASLLLFVLLAPAAIRERDPKSDDKSFDVRPANDNCPEAALSVDQWRPDEPDARSGAVCREHRGQDWAHGVANAYFCEPRALGTDAEWRVTVRLTVEGQVPGSCDYRLRSADRVERDWATNTDNVVSQLTHRAFQGQNEVSTERTPTRLVTTYTLDLPPWRTFTLLATSKYADQPEKPASRPSVLSVQTPNGPNLRLTAFGQTLLVGFVVVVFVGLVLQRPRGRSRRWWGRAAYVATLSGLGGAVAGGCYALLPPDLGGFDRSVIHEWRLLWSIGGGALGGAVMGVVLDWLRRVLPSYGRPARFLGVALLLMLLPGGLVLLLAAAGSEMTRDIVNRLFGHGLAYFQVWYLYLAASVMLPIVWVNTEPLRREYNQAAGTFPIRGGTAWLLLGASLFSGALAQTVTVAVAAVAKVVAQGYPPEFDGFGKVLSVVGFLLIATPALAAFAVSVTLGEDERDDWVKQMSRRLNAAMAFTSHKRHAAIRRITVMFAQEFPFRRYSREHLQPLAARVLAWLEQQTDEVDEVEREILKKAMVAAGLGRDDPEAWLVALERRLREIVDNYQTRVVTRPFPLAVVKTSGEDEAVEHYATSGEREAPPATLRAVRGTIRVEAEPDRGLGPNTREVDCGGPLLFGLTLRATGVLNRVLDELVGEVADNQRALGGHRIFIRMDDHEDANVRELVGNSFELALALCLYELGHPREPKPVVPWIATGLVHATGLAENGEIVDDWTIGPVLHVPAKIRLEPIVECLFLVPMSALPEVRESVPERRCAALESRRDLARLRRLVRECHESNAPIVVGVATLELAIALLYP